MAKAPPKCKYCNMVLKWPPWVGKPQRPVEPNGQQHDCPEFGSGDGGNSGKWIKLKAEDLEHCELCNHWLVTKEAHEKYPTVNYTSMEDHLRTFHPNGEILDEIDFIVISDEEKEKRRTEQNTPKPTKLYTNK